MGEDGGLIRWYDIVNEELTRAEFDALIERAGKRGPIRRSICLGMHEYIVPDELELTLVTWEEEGEHDE